MPEQQPTWPPLPPADETPEERLSRLQEEALAKERSDEIDKELMVEREREKNLKFRAKILLLGQAESGKSTVLKNFQLQFAPKAFQAEAAAWRPVIHLNLVRSVNFIVNFLTTWLASIKATPNSGSEPESSTLQPSPEVRNLLVRLSPLRQVEETLNKSLWGSPSDSSSTSQAPPKYHPAKAPEVSAPSGYAWKNAFINHRSHGDSISGPDLTELVQARRVLAACGNDIVNLWRNKDVRRVLQLAEVALEEQPGFFLDEAERITAEDYKPLPEDVLKARVTTVGPEEHTIIDESSFARHWTIYDVNGHQGHRAAWAQFFDDVNIIIFLAPMSAFNQTLAEDDSVNRLMDSFKLWKNISSNKILENLEFVIFLNKLDVLQAKLRADIQFSKFVTSYGSDKPNETKPVAKYLLDVFTSLHQKHSPRKRKLHPHLTCAVDTSATASVIARIRDMVLVRLLASTNIL